VAHRAAPDRRQKRGFNIERYADLRRIFDPNVHLELRNHCEDAEQQLAGLCGGV
jgi:hypothetical protein